MISPVNNTALYNLTSGIERNAILNRGIMETVGVEIPWVVMSNNNDERVERSFRAFFFLFFSLAIPALIMPAINKMVMKKLFKDIKPEELNVLKVSKKYLTEDAKLMIKGFKETAADLEKKDKFKGITKHFDNLLERFKGKEEELKKLLIEAHKRIFRRDAACSNLLTVSIPWCTNYFTEKRTGRKGYVGEFKMADREYTDKMTKKHQRTKRIKLVLSYLSALIPATVAPILFKKAMSTPLDKLGPIMKLLKKKIHHFDYTDAVFLSKASLFVTMAFGDVPTYMLACRDKHELKYKFNTLLFMYTMLFGAEPVLNNIVGRAIDKDGQLFNYEGFKKTGFLKKLTMPFNNFEKLSALNASSYTKKAAIAMYWANLAFVTILLGFGVPYFSNKQLRKDVKKAQGEIPQKDISNNNMKNIYEFLKFVQDNGKNTGGIAAN